MHFGSEAGSMSPGRFVFENHRDKAIRRWR